MCLHSFISERVADSSVGGRLGAGTCVSVHTNKATLCQWSREVRHCGGRSAPQPSACKQSTVGVPSLLAAPLATERADCPCVLLSPVPLIKLIVAPRKRLPSDVYSRLGLAIKMMNELTANPCKRALGGEINT